MKFSFIKIPGNLPFYSTYAQNILTLLSGTVLAQAVILAASPLLSRLYDPATFGLFALFSSLLTILASVITGRYDLAIVLPKQDKSAIPVLALTGITVFFLSVITAILVFFFHEPIANLLNCPDLASWLELIPLFLLILGMEKALSAWLTRFKRFTSISLSRAGYSILCVGYQITAGFLGAGIAGLLYGRLAGQILSTTILARSTWSKHRNSLFTPPEFSKIKASARLYIDFPRYSGPQALLNTLSQNICPICLTWFYGIEKAGLYAITTRALCMPIRLLSEAIKPVFYQKVTEIKNNQGNIYPFFRKMTLCLFLTGLVPSIIIIIFGPQIFSFVFGQTWYHAGYYARYLMPWLFIAFINPPAILMIPVLNLQKKHMFYEMMFFICRIVAMVILASFFSDITAITGYAVIGVLFNGGLVLYILRSRLEKKMILQKD